MWTDKLKMVHQLILTAGLNKLDQAEEYLLQARWTVLKTVECPNTIKHKLCRHLGLLYAAKGQFDMALRELADDVSCLVFYFSSGRAFVAHIGVVSKLQICNRQPKLVVTLHFLRYTESSCNITRV